MTIHIKTFKNKHFIVLVMRMNFKSFFMVELYVAHARAFLYFWDHLNNPIVFKSVLTA